jgi:hypothetical protein
MTTEQTTEQYHTCEDCGRNCYTGGDAYPDGYTCVDCDDDNMSCNTQSECCECECQEQLKFFNGKTYCAECRDPSEDSDSEDEDEE